MSRHTPGPWRVGSGRVVLAVNPDAPADVVGVADCRTVDVCGETAAANARLIAQAPALVDWLGRALDRLLLERGELRRRVARGDILVSTVSLDELDALIAAGQELRRHIEEGPP